MELVATLCAEFAEAKHVFLYRHALDWLSSRLRIAVQHSPTDDLERRRELEAVFARLHPYIAQHLDPSCPMSLARLWTWCWVSSMDRYLDLAESGFPILAARYEDLRLDPTAVLRAVFDHCALSVEDWDALDAVLARDAQEGTVMARDPTTLAAFEMPPGAIEESRAIIQCRDRLRDPAVIVPRTVMLSRLSAERGFLFGWMRSRPLFVARCGLWR
jgi:hypothetical protein